MARLSACAAAWRDALLEIDLNPVVVAPAGGGARVVDVAVVGRMPPAGPEAPRA